jgi:hypothetical protein
MVRSVAATICWAALGTVDKALRMKVHATPLPELAEEVEPELQIVCRSHIGPQHFPFADAAHPDGES